MNRNKGENINGWLVFDKPLNMTSAQAVAFVKRTFNANKAGHGGTLDPLATGVLPIALGEATKTVDYVLNSEKHYEFEATFGEERSTDDAEGEVIKTSNQLPTKQQVLNIISEFMGEIQQTPPLYSAIKVGGRAAYSIARSGGDVELSARKITVYKLELLDFTPKKASFRLHASKGTYVRSLARDIGRKLGCYAFVSKLHRTKAGKFNINQAISKEKLDLCIKNGHSAESLLLNIAEVLDDILVYTASVEEVKDLKNGKKILLPHLQQGVNKVLDVHGNLVSIIEVEMGGAVKILRNFNL